MTVERNYYRPTASLVLSVVCAAVAMLATGCDSPPSGNERRGPVSQAEVKDGLFHSVAENLGHLEDFDVNQIMPQICDRLNQWNQQEKPKVNWQLDPMVAELPAELTALPVVKTLDLVQFRLPDAWFLQESVWLRDASKLARSDQFDDAVVAERMFDWVVRNIQLDAELPPDQPPTIRRRPFETMLFGRGTALDRAWIFILMARQQGLDAVLLAIDQGEGKPPRPWCVGVAGGDNLYLFDCRLGLPIPGPGGKGVATLAEVTAEDGLLRKLDLDGDHPYPVTHDDLSRVVALVEASPYALSKRMALVESRLSGKRKTVLTAQPSAVAERIKKLPGISGVKLWQEPFEVALWQSQLTESQIAEASREMFLFRALPTLLAGRALLFKGEYDGEKGAKKHFLDARPSDEVIENYRLPPEVAKKVKRENMAQLEARQTILMRLAKQDASYWLGLICFDQRDYPVAIDYFAKRTLEKNPRGPWVSGARYNLARTYEAQNKIDEAVEQYNDQTSPQSHGNQLRARWLKERAAPAAAESAETSGTSGS